MEVGECLEIGVDSWLLEPVPLAGRANAEVKRVGRKTKRDKGGGEGKEVEEVKIEWIRKFAREAKRRASPELWPHLAVMYRDPAGPGFRRLTSSVC